MSRPPAVPGGTLVLDSEGLAKAVLRDRTVTGWLALARAEVRRKADSIADRRRREHFLNAVPLNRALFADAATVRDEEESGTPG